MENLCKAICSTLVIFFVQPALGEDNSQIFDARVTASIERLCKNESIKPSTRLAHFYSSGSMKVRSEVLCEARSIRASRLDQLDEAYKGQELPDEEFREVTSVINTDNSNLGEPVMTKSSVDAGLVQIGQDKPISQRPISTVTGYTNIQK